MNNIAVYTITSGLHDNVAVSQISDNFLKAVFPGEIPTYDLYLQDFSTFGTHLLDLIYVRTGGAENTFKELLPGLLAKGTKKFYLLTSGMSNSLAASLEILSYLKQQGLDGEVLHGPEDYLCYKVDVLMRARVAKFNLKNHKLGVIGQPSDWLIASKADAAAVKERLGATIEDIPMEELVNTINSEPLPMDSFQGAERILNALGKIVQNHGLTALTLRCFDLITQVQNTGCLALAALNSTGVPSSCEGDVPALLSMLISYAAVGVSGFQANPARINTQTGEILFAHCTVPFNMTKTYEYTTHFESGIGVGIHGELPEGPVTVFKVSGDLKRSFIAQGKLVHNQYEPNLCRTQVLVKLEPADAKYFLTDPIGNHHIVIPGHCADLLEAIVKE